MSFAQTGETVRVFRAKGRTGLQAAGFLVGGSLFFLVLIGVFLLALAIPKRPGQTRLDLMPGMIGGASVIGVGLIARGIFLLKSLQRVIVDDKGVHLEGFISRTSVRWDEIEWLERDRRAALFGGKSIEVLKILGDRGFTLATIPDTLTDFPGLVAEIEAHSAAARGAPTSNPVADEKRRIAKESKTQRVATVILGFFTLLMGIIFGVGVNEDLHLRRYATEGVRVEASIIRRWMVRVTPRLEYRFTDQQGREHTREVMMSQEAWDALEGGKTVRVEYLASSPAWNRPVAGEDVQTRFGGKFLFVTGGGTLLFGTLMIFAALGYDLKTENGRTRLLRRGRLIKEFGPRRPQQQQSSPARALGELLPVPILPPPPLTPAKPKGIIALGIIAVAFGCVQAALAVLRGIVWSRPYVQLPDGRILLMNADRLMQIWNVADGVVALLLIALGILLLRLKPSARPFGILVATLQLLSSIGTITVMIVDMARAPEQTGPDSTTMIAGQFAAILGQMIGMIFPTVLLLILSRRRTAQALAESNFPTDGARV